MQRLITFIYVIIFSTSQFVSAQEIYNNCAEAFELCPSTTFTLNNIAANSTVCPNCEDDFNFCFSGQNTIWMKFTTNDNGGDVQLDFSQIIFENIPGQGDGLQAAIIEATLPCISSSYSVISNCESNQNANFSLIANDLPANTTYYVVVNGTMGASANAEATFDVFLHGDGVLRQPDFTIWTENLTVCAGNNVTFYATVTDCDAPSNIEWYLNGNHIASTADHFFIYSDIENGDVIEAKISCFEQCRDTLTSNPLTLTQIDFLVDAGPDKTIQQGSSTHLEGTTSELDITWTPNYNITDPNSIHPVVFPEHTTTYFLTVSNGICSITDEVTVFVDSELEIPNTFSPNGDGINDTWEILGIEAYPNCHIQVYTRWGQLVFQTSGYSKEKRWDGTSNSGRELATGTYYYVINLRDDQYDEPLKGIVSIVR